MTHKALLRQSPEQAMKFVGWVEEALAKGEHRYWSDDDIAWLADSLDECLRLVSKRMQELDL